MPFGMAVCPTWPQCQQRLFLPCITLFLETLPKISKKAGL
jgi:hypothetical protein